MSESARTKCAVPPAIGTGKPWRILVHEWSRIDPNNLDESTSETLFIPHGMRVHEKCHEAYWEARQAALVGLEAYRAAGVGPEYPYFLMDDADVVVGCGEFPADYSMDDMAWFACTFLERGLRLAFAMPQRPATAPAT
jgi:hypothetical protein